MRRLPGLLLLSFLATLLSCSRTIVRDSNQSRIDFSPIERASNAHHEILTEQRVEVITTAVRFAQLWQQLHGMGEDARAMPTIDFTRNVVVLATAGEKPSSGYDVEIGKMNVLRYDDGERVGRAVDIVLTEPSTNCDIGATKTTPFILVRMAKIDEEMIFEWMTETRLC
jgi:hypothetical protein